MNIVTEIFDLISDAFAGFFGVLNTGTTSVIALFYNTTTGFTLIGTLMLTGLGVGLVWTLISFVTRLVKGSAR